MILTTLTQDQEHHFNALVAEMRALPGVRPAVGPVALMIEQFLIYLLRLMAGFAGRVRTEELPVMAPTVTPEPEMKEAIAEAAQVDLSLPVMCRTPEVELPDGMKLPRRVRVGKLKDLSGLAPARTQRVAGGCRPQWHGPETGWAVDAGFLRFDLKKRVLRGVDICAYFVTVKQR